MVGVRQFDEAQVLTKALDVFWRKGLHATSMRDLAEATGVQRGSLYHAYGDKERLFLLAFERYAARFLSEARSALDGTEAGSALLRFFDVAIANMRSGSPPRGCLTTKMATEAALAGPRIKQRLRALLDELGIVVRDALARDPFRSALGLPPAEAAEVIVTFTRGLAVMERLYQDQHRLKDSAAALVRALLAQRLATPHRSKRASPRRAARARSKLPASVPTPPSAPARGRR
ncbi:MAG TPA: TetR/AcrR family transcriptional regulator [Stellaceae bacterium]|jgi:TetR/AcrR family transcriptional repressor of nem operon|nr:TetR/AcrR family transcriptional regulator [Stellaceae bacterium]